MLSFARLRPSVLGSRTHRIHYERPTKCRYARVDKAAPADYTITSCRGTKSARNLVDSKHTSFYEARSRPPFSRTYIRELRGNPSDYVFDIFAAFARTVRVIERFFLFFLFAFCPLLSRTWFSRCEAERSGHTVAKNEICNVISSRVKTIHC